jgi:hypothetical protein
VFRQSWEGQSYKEIAASTEYEYDYIKDAGAKLWKLLSTALQEKVKKDNLKSVLKRYLRRSQVNLQRNLTIEVNLSGANLSGANLSGARLFANLNEADYVQTDLDKIINAESETELSNSENEIDWNGFCFHSDAQVKIAETLDRTSTLFIPNTQLRLTTPAGRQNHKAQFLVFHQGKLGILEVDGPEDAAQDEALDILAINSGICLVKHYDATRCSEQPDLVVQEFLEILSQE